MGFLNAAMFANKKRLIIVGCLGVAAVGLISSNALKLGLNNATNENNSFNPGMDRSTPMSAGDEQCQLKRGIDAPQYNELFSTLLVAYPGSGKRTAFQQLQGVTEFRPGDDFNLTPDSVSKRFAFMKTNYPQHDGVWSFGGQMDQVVLLIRNPRWAFPSYQSLLFEINYSNNWETSYALRENVYTKKSPIKEWNRWRDNRFDVEIKKWGWFIDYWMEGGVFRSLFTNGLTTLEHFQHLTDPVMYARAELLAEQEAIETSGEVKSRLIDRHCVRDIGDCKPVAIASFEKIINPATGPDEVDRFITAIEGKTGMPTVDKEAKECVWRELIINEKGFMNDFHIREKATGPEAAQYVFSKDQMEAIQDELGRLRTKYSSGEYINQPVAQSLVEYLDLYIAENDAEIQGM
jgi:hypothetical protein